MTNSPTPLTDAACEAARNISVRDKARISKVQGLLIETARTLERDRAELVAALEELIASTETAESVREDAIRMSRKEARTLLARVRS